MLVSLSSPYVNHDFTHRNLHPEFVTPYPSYSPHLPPSDFQFFGFLQDALRGCRFGDSVGEVFRRFNQEFYAIGLQLVTQSGRLLIMKGTLWKNNMNFLKDLFININQLDALNFIISLLYASTCFEHMCLSSGGQNCIIQSLVSSH